MYKSLIVFGLLCKLISGQNQSSLDENVKDTPSKRQALINDIISLDLDSPSDIHIKIIKENNNQKLPEVDDGLLMYHGAEKHEKLSGSKNLKNHIYFKDVNFDDHGGESLNANQQIGRFHAKNDRNSYSKFSGGSLSEINKINKSLGSQKFKPIKNNHGASYHRDNTFIEQVKHNSPRNKGNPSPENEGIMIVELDNESPTNVLQNYKALSNKGLKAVSINNANYGKVREFIDRGVGNVENDCEHWGNSLKVIQERKKQQFHGIDNTIFSKTRKQPLQKQNCGGFRRESLENGSSISYKEIGGEMIEESHCSNSGEDDSLNTETSRNDDSKFGNVRVENHVINSDNDRKLDEQNGDESSLISGHELKDGSLKEHTSFGEHKIDTKNNGDYSGDLSNYETVDESPINEQVILNGVDDYDSPTLTSFDELDTENRTNNLVANYIMNQSGAGDKLNHKEMKYENYHDNQSFRKDLTDYGKSHRSYIDNQNLQRSKSYKDIPPNDPEFEVIANHMLNKLDVKHLESGENHSNEEKNYRFSINKDTSINHGDFKHDFNDQENKPGNKNDENSENSLLQEEKRYNDKSDVNNRNDLDLQGSKFNEKKHGNFENDIMHQGNGLDSDSNKIFENNSNPKGSERDEKYDVNYGNEPRNEYKNQVQIENYLKQQKSVFDKINHYQNQNHNSDSTDLEENVDTKNHDNFGRNNNINQQGNGNDNQGDEIIQDDRRVKNYGANRNSKFYDYLKNRGGSLNGADTLVKKQELNSKKDHNNNFGSDKNNQRHDFNFENDGKYNFGTDKNDEEDDVNSKKDVGSSDRHKILMDAIRNRFRGTTGSYFPEKTEKTPSESEEDVEFSPRKSSRPICQDITPEAHCIKEDDKYFCKIGKSSYTIYTGPNPSVSSKVIEDYVRSMFQKYGEGDRCLDMSFGAGKHGPCLKNKMPVDNQMSHFSQTTTISSKLFPGRKRGTLNIICTPLAPPPKGVDCRDDDTGREVYYECRWRTPNKIVQC